MAREGVYAFRARNVNLDIALRREAGKPAGNQGTRTFARDLRRFFLLAGLLTRDHDGVLCVSSLGRQLVRREADARESMPVWRTAFGLVVLANNADGTLAHPYKILLRLVGERPGIQAAKLALALEARDDSEEEFARIRALADRPWDEVRLELGISEHQARNATKILPAIARQLDDLRADGDGYTLVARANVQRRVRRERRRREQLGNRRVTPETIARAPTCKRCSTCRCYGRT